MALVKKRGNGRALPSLRNNLSELFDMDRFFNEPFFESSLLNSSRFSRVPATNIQETDNEYMVEIAAPGMKKKDFHVNVENNTLEIKVEREDESEEKKARYTRREYDYTAFFRSFDLPDSIDSEKIKAEYQDGILKVRLPKVATAKRKPAKEIAID